MFWLVQLNSVKLDVDTGPAAVLDAKTVVVAVMADVVVGELETGAVVCATDNNVALTHWNPPPFAQHNAAFSAVPQQLFLSPQGEIATWSPMLTREDIMC